MKRFVLITASFIIISVMLVIFVGIGAFMLFFTLCHLFVTFSLYKSGILEWIRGKRFDEIQKVNMLKITKKVIIKQALFVTNIVYITITIFLMYHNIRIIDLLL